MKYKRLPPLKHLKEILDYNPDTGVFTWKRSGHGVKVGQEAGGCSYNKDGRKYKVIRINKIRYRANRLAYYMYHGIDPLQYLVDHKDNDSLNNKISNLRLATISQNGFNHKIYNTNTSGITGVSWIKRENKWAAQITAFGKMRHLGYFIDKEDAIKARKEAEIKYCGEFRRED